MHPIFHPISRPIWKWRSRLMLLGRRLERRPVLLALIGVLLAWIIAGVPFLDFAFPTRLWGDRIFLLLHGRMFLEWPHVFRAATLGYPGELDLLQFPFTDFTERLLQFAATIGSRDVIVGANVYYIAIIAANFLAAFVALRGFAVRPWRALAGAIAFAFIPYFAARSGGHDYLAAYYAAPLAFVVLRNVVAAARGPRPLRQTATDPVMLACCAVIATSGIYYTFFAIVLWAFAGTILAVQERRWVYLTAFGVTASTTLVVLSVPYVMLFAIAADNGAFPARSFTEQPMYALRPADLIFALDRFGLLSSARDQYVELRGGTEGADAWPGPVLSVIAILAALFGTLLPRARACLAGQPGWERFAPLLSGFLAFVLIFCSPFGLGLLFNLLVRPEIRAQNRVAPFLAFTAVLLFLWGWQQAAFWLRMRLGRRWGGAIASIALALLIVVNCKDSLGILWREQRGLRHDPAFAAEMTSVRAVLAAADREGLERVLQLPALPWPEPPIIHGFLAYTHFLPFIFSPPGSTRRWSYGAAWGSDGIAKLKMLEALADRPCLTEMMTSLGFDAVMLDRRAYDAAELTAWETRLTNENARLVTDDALRLLYRLTPSAGSSCSEPVIPLGQWQSAARGGPLEPLFVSGWQDGESWGRWGRGATHRLILPMQGLPAGDLVLDLKASQFGQQDRVPPGVALRVNGTLVTMLTFDKPREAEEHRVVIPQRVLAGAEFAMIEFAPVGGSSSAARLGLGLDALRLSGSSVTEH